VDAQKPAVYQKKVFENITPSFHEVQVKKALHEFKEAIAHVSEVAYDEKNLKKRPGKKFEFCNGFNTVFGADRYRIAESLFQGEFDFTGVTNILI
jgi:hypothetical protein